MNVQDRRRILGPSNAKPLIFVPNETPQQTSSTDSHIRLQRDIVSNANGSSVVETSSISLLTSVYGPRSTRSNSFEPNATVNVVMESERFSTSNMKELSNFLVSVLKCVLCLEKYPKAGIDIFVNFNIEDEVELVAYIPLIIMGVMVALIDANIELVDVIGGVNVGNTLCVLGQNGEQLLGLWSDPSSVASTDTDTDTLDLNEIISKCKDLYPNSRKQLIEFISTF